MTTRRDFVLSFPALGILAESLTATGQATSQATDTELGRSTVFEASRLPVKETASGSAQHVASGKLASGEPVELHNVMLKPGLMPHPPHRHAHTEFMIVHEGNISFVLGEVTMPAGPGDILYARAGELHCLKNAGSIDARYAVIAIGGDAG